MQASKLRFSAARLFYFVTLAAASTGLFGYWGMPIAGFILLIWLQILAGARREAQATSASGTWSASPQVVGDSASALRGGVSKVELLVVLLISSLVIGLVMPSRCDSDPMLHAQTSMKIVAQAVQTYEQRHGRLPAIVFDEQGQPLHSWRALILPYLGEQQLASAYHLDEPWNSPHNLQLAAYRPWHFRPFYPQVDADLERSTTDLQLLRDARDRSYIVEHEATSGNWLQPAAPCRWQQFATEPTVERGFWHEGFLLSTFRGRLAVTAERAYRVGPTPLAGPEEAAALFRQADRAGSQELGTVVRCWHVQNTLRLSFFLLVALYPYRWLKQSTRV
ncbi:MAG: DUF1559 domain-containing protein [Planctomycetales bacterium]|nr:DUF1559 domain-containing protein [Planctomycetales bacterium]